MQNRLDQLFIRLAKLFRTIEEKGLIPVKLVEEKDIIDKFYNKSVSMVLRFGVIRKMHINLRMEHIMMKS